MKLSQHYPYWIKIKLEAKKRLWRKLPVVLRHKQYRLLKFYSQFIDADSTCFDIGGFRGDMTEIFYLLGKNVISLEPQKDYFDLTSRKFALLRRIVNLNLIVSDKVGSEAFYVGNPKEMSTIDADFITHYRAQKPFNWQSPVDVNSVTLDHLISEYGQPSFCKIDVEGAELQVLQGLSKPVEYISIEFHSTLLNKTFECIDYIKTIRCRELLFNFSSSEYLGFDMSDWSKDTELVKNELASSGKSGNLYINMKF